MASPVGGSSQPLYQIYGLASGFDTQGIIDATLDIFRRPLDSLLDQRDEVAFEREIFREVNDALYRLQQVTLNLRLESTFRSKIVTSSDESVVTAIATTEAVRGTHTIEVDTIAEAARAYGDVVTTYRRTDIEDTAGVAQAGGSAHGTTQGTHTVNFTSGYAGRIAGWVTGMDLDRTLSSYGVANAEGLTFDIGGRTLTLTGLTTESTVRDLIRRVNQGGTGVTAEIKGGRLTLTAGQGGVNFALRDAANNYTDSIAAKMFGATDERTSVAEVVGGRQVMASQTLASLGVVNAGDFDILVEGDRTNVVLGLGVNSTVQDLVDEINNQVLGVEARIADGRVVISAQNVGTGIEIADLNYSDDIAALVMSLSGRQNSQGPAVNGGIVNVRAASGAHITGGIAGVSASSPLSSYGVTTPNGMTITADDGTSYSVEGLTGASTVQDVINTINRNAPWVQASVLDGRLVLSAADAGTNFTLEDVDETSGGLASKLLGLSSPAAATNIVQSTKGTGFGSAVVADAAEGKNASVVGQVPSAGDLDETQQLSFYGLADADVTGFSIRVGTTTTNVGMATATQTVGELVQAIDAVDGVRAEIYDGRLVIESEYGNRDFTIIDQNYTTDIARVIMGLTGEQASTAAVTGDASGMLATDALSAHGVTDASSLTFSVDGTEYAVTGLTTASTVQDLIDAINAQVSFVDAELTDDGRLAVRATRAHSNFTISDANYYGTIAGEIVGLTRAQSTLDPSSSNATVNAGATGAVVMGPELTGSLTDTLNLFGVTTADGDFTFDYRGETQTVDFNSGMTLAQLVDAINALPGIRADFVGGRLLVAGEDARENFTVRAEDSTYNSGDGFRELLGTDVDQSTTSPAAAGAYVAAASTDEFTASDLVLPLSGGNPQFHTEIGSGGHVLDSLYEGGLLQGTGVNQSFTTGTAYLFTSAELASGVDTSSRVDGGALVGQRESFSTTKVAGTGTAQSLVGDAVFDGAYAGTYQVKFVNATDYVIQTTGGAALGEAVADGSQFVAYENSMLAGSAFTFTSNAAPASGATWEFTLGLDATRSLADAGFATPATEATNGTFTINGTRITITDYTTETVESVLAKINSSGAGVVANYDRLEDRFIISATELGADGEIDMGSVDDSSNFLAIAKLDLGALGSEATQTVGVENEEIDTSATLSDAGFSTAISGGTFTINGVKLYVDPSQDSMDDLIERINESAAHVIAKYDETGDRLILENDMEDPATSSNTIKVRVGSSTDTSNFLGAVRLVTPGEMGFQRQVGEAGEDASFTVDGITYSRTTNSVDDVITGVTLDLRGTSDGIVTLDVEVDTERGKEAIAEWIAEWNEIVLTMNPEPLTDEEERYLEPLSDSDRANMTFAEIEEYEALNRQYRIQELIRTDSSMRRIFYQMRNIITEPVDGLPNPLDALVDLGIDVYTPLNTIVPTGQLVLDSTDEEEILEKLNDNFELTKALREDEEGITKLFGNEEYEGSGSFVNTQLEFSGDTFTMPSAGGDLKFQVGDGTSWSGTITLEEGRTYTREELLDILDQAGLRVPTDDDYPQDRANVRVSYSGPNTLAFSILNFSTGASVWFRDLSEGTNDVSTILGVDLNEADPGIAEALHSLVGDTISSTGVLGARTRVGGSLDRQIQSLQSQITDWQRRVALKEYYLNQQFSRFEAQLAEIQQMGQAVTNLSNMLAGSQAAQSQGQQ